MRFVVVWSLLIAFVMAKEGMFRGNILLLDQNASDPVYSLPLNKYKKWLCEAELKDGKKAWFVSVKSMMQVYWHQPYFLKRGFLSAPIKAIYVQDYMTGEKIPAEKAVYLFGSRIVGPHGDELIPFATQQNAELFMIKNGGTKILPFQRLSKGLIRYLDM